MCDYFGFICDICGNKPKKSNIFLDFIPSTELEKEEISF